MREAGHETVGADRRTGQDLSVPGQIELLLHDNQPDVVVHLAAKYGRLPCEADPKAALRDNVVATTNVARACRNTRLVFVSSSEIYGDHGPTPISEQDTYQELPHNLYGLTKRWGEEVCRTYAKNLTVARCNMVYGPGQPVGPGLAALPTFLHNAKQRKPIIVHRGSRRSWCYITDTTRALRLLIEEADSGRWNVSNDLNTRPMLEIAQIACDLTRASRSLIHEVQVPERQTLVKDISAAKLRLFGWKPTVPLEEGMRRTLAAM